MIGNLLSSLDKVKQTGQNKWIACCPAHADRSPSLSIKDDDGAVLFYCHAGCDSDTVLEAAGLSWNDILPNDKDFIPRPQAYPELEADYFVIEIWGVERKKGLPITDEDLARYKMALRRTGAVTRKQTPPYTNRIKGDLIFLCYGSNAWKRAAKSPEDCLVLPPFDDPHNYRWPVKGRMVVMLDCGNSPRVYTLRIRDCIRPIARLTVAEGVVYE